ncbi:hypothetical protein [Jeotgalicoccus meleagridis]|mgnify:CR=1 FL=1|uniref:Lipoprotein n=1 Tax=Jeotgalicoccus meleagridis TaxID=2759181 RepID=A0A6V7RPN9_9STAP|nr:hypothetical protein [Jeotgalicoccus meleagridis]CAD2079640.1 hypothetical protein JEODO184_01726 [Jeotgalicoccus meleagridis]HIW38417.1 hypothetical protein [Candidatus Jeotgalicoccus stercoravium]
MKQILTIVFVILLAGCNSADRLAKSENLPIITKSHTTINHLVINSVEEVANTNTVDINQTDNKAETLQDVSTLSKKDLREVGQELSEQNNEIIMVWNDLFIPIYESYYNNYDETVIRENISDLNAAYKDLQKKINNVSLPSSLTAVERTKIEAIKEDLSYAISNRQLAIIEMQSMIAKADASHSAFMEVHISNSDRYLEHAKTLCDDLNLNKNALVTAK